MEPIRVQWIDRKGFSLTEWIAERLEPVMIKRFMLEPADAEGERSVQLMFQRDRYEGNVVMYREVLHASMPSAGSPQAAPTPSEAAGTGVSETGARG